MYKYVGVGVLMTSILLTGCEGDFTFDEATVISKSSRTTIKCGFSMCDQYDVTVRVDGSKYIVRTNQSGYNLVTAGSNVKVKYDSVDGYAILTPVTK